MLELSRRRLLATTSALPVATGLLPVAALGTARPARPTEDPWARGARPDFVLSIARHEMAPFGTPIQALLVGGTWPGTTIRYRKGDRFRVLVENALDQPTSLHWHGLVCPNLEDGVPNVTQAPIAPGDALYYEFDLKQAGTFWYHSHFGLQEQQGLTGPLIIEDPNEPHAYEEDLIVMLSDVVDVPVGDVVPRIRQRSLEVAVSFPYTLPDGAPFPIDVLYAGYLLNGHTPDDPWSPTTMSSSATSCASIL